jgi:hypothetical protein
MFDFFLDHISNDDLRSNGYELKKIYWPNTVHLSIFITQLTDLQVLLDTNVLPVLDHLCVTFIREKAYYYYLENDYQVENFTDIKSRLRSFKLSYVSFGNLLKFLSSVHMPLLEELTLMEINDDSKPVINEFYRDNLKFFVHSGFRIESESASRLD